MPSNVAAAFNAAGVAAAVVHGECSTPRRAGRRSAAYAAGEVRVIVNVAVLTEGWDHPPTSCVVLLRPSSYKSTMIQMVGRGLRTVDPEEHPGRRQDRLHRARLRHLEPAHGTLEQDVDLDGREPAPGEAPTRTCPGMRGGDPARRAPSARSAAHVFESRGRGAGAARPASS